MSQLSMVSNGIFSETDKKISMSCGINVALASPDPLCSKSDEYTVER